MKKTMAIWGTVCLALAACGTSKSKDKDSSGDDSGSNGPQVKLNMVANATSSLMSFQKALNPLGMLSGLISPFGVGANDDSELLSLKYVFGMVSICEGLTTVGSGFSNPTNCITVYSGPTIGDGSSGSITPGTLADYADDQIDMMDATSRAKINTAATLTSQDAHSYNYAVINWYTPIAVKGCVAVGGTPYCTKSTGATYTSGSPSYTTTTAALASSSTSDAQEAVVVSSNGGSFFKFQSPFVISADDISSNTTYTVDMVFNPSAVLAADSAQSNAGNLRGSDASLYVPMLNIAPVPRKGSQTTKRETYLTTDNCPSTRAKYRVELYYNSDDENTVLGATGAYVGDSSSSGSFSIMQADMGGKVIEIEAAGDGSLTLRTPGASDPQDWISGLTRGANGTLTMYADGNGGTPTSCAYNYVGTVTVE